MLLRNPAHFPQDFDFGIKPRRLDAPDVGAHGWVDEIFLVVHNEVQKRVRSPLVRVNVGPPRVFTLNDQDEGCRLLQPKNIASPSLVSN